MSAQDARNIGKERERRNAQVRFRKIEKQIKSQCYLGDVEQPTPEKLSPDAKKKGKGKQAQDDEAEDDEAEDDEAQDDEAEDDEAKGDEVQLPLAQPVMNVVTAVPEEVFLPDFANLSLGKLVPSTNNINLSDICTCLINRPCGRTVL